MLQQIFTSLCKIHSPPRKEHQMLSYMETFFKQRGIVFQSDIKWGVYACLKGKGQTKGKDILLMAHLDSTHTTPSTCSSIQYDAQQAVFTFEPEVGLDDKTGLSISLAP